MERSTSAFLRLPLVVALAALLLPTPGHGASCHPCVRDAGQCRVTRARVLHEARRGCRFDRDPAACRALVRARRAAAMADCARVRTSCVRCCQQQGGADACRQSRLAVSCTTNADCNDANVCTDDLCDPNLGCLHSDVSVTCDDGDACTTGDTCNGGVCVGGNPATGCDSCQAVATIPAEGGTFVGQTSGSGTLSGSCASGPTAGERVYAWTPTLTGQATIETCGGGTAFDTILYVRQGSCTAGAEAACDDDAQGCGTSLPGDTSHGSRVTPTVTAGNTYYIVVDGFAGLTGAFALTVFPPSVCGNGVREGPEECDGADHAACASQACTAQCTCTAPPGGEPDLTAAISDAQVAFNSTVDPGDVFEGCATGPTVDLLRFSTTTRNIGTADFFLGDPQCPPCLQNPGATCANPLFICSPAGGHNHGHYQNYARYELLSGGQVVATGHKQGFCLEDGSCTNSKYTCTYQGLTPGCSDLYASNLGCQYVDITGLSPGGYTLRVTVDPFNRVTELNESNNVAEASITIPPKGIPTGACTTATEIPAAGGVFTGTTSGASTEAGTCGASGNAPEQAFKWTPATSGTATLETCSAQTTFDTLLYVRQGACNDAQVGCNDDTTGCGISGDGANPHRGSHVSLDVSAGQTYWIFVDGFATSSGSFALTVTPPGGTTPTTVPAPTTTVTSTSSTSSSTLPMSSTSTSTSSSTRPPTTGTSTSTSTSTRPPTTSTSSTSTSTSTRPPTTSTSSTSTSRPPTTVTTTTLGPNHAPVCAGATADPGSVWPPDHKLVDVNIHGVTDPDHDHVVLTVTRIRQNELPNILGSGHTCPDAAGIGKDKAQVRAERSGLGGGRVYHITFRADDGRGGICSGVVTVCVPHNGGPKGHCIDEGPLFDSTGPCLLSGGDKPPKAKKAKKPKS